MASSNSVDGLQGDVSGLEVEDSQSPWNVCDSQVHRRNCKGFLDEVTYDMIRSTVHRVRSRSPMKGGKGGGDIIPSIPY